MKYSDRFKNNILYNRILKEKEEEIISLFPNLDVVPFCNLDNIIRYRNNIYFTIEFNQEKLEFVIGILKKSFISMNNWKIDHPLVNFSKVLEDFKYLDNDSVIPSENLIYASDDSLKITQIFSNFINLKKHTFPKDIFRAIQIRESNIQDQKYYMLIIKLYIQDTSYQQVWNNLEDELIIYLNNNFKSSKLTSVYKQITDCNIQNTNKDEFLLIYHDSDMIQKIDNLYFRISPGAFFQVNIKTAKFIYKKVRELYLDYLNKFNLIYDDIYVLDICCGTGTLGLFLANYCYKVFGFEISNSAIKDCLHNSKFNNITNTEYIEGPVEDTINQVFNNLELDKYIVPVINPPKRGLYEPVINILNLYQSKINFIIYISCNYKSFYKDYQKLSNNYCISKINLVDQFPLTKDSEMIVILKKIN